MVDSEAQEKNKNTIIEDKYDYELPIEYSPFAVKIGIFYNDNSFAKKAEQKCVDIFCGKIVRIIKHSKNKTFFLSDGSVILIEKLSSLTRGRKFNKIIVQDSIPRDIVCSLLLPQLSGNIERVNSKFEISNARW